MREISETVGPRPARDDLADRIGELGNFPQAPCHGRDTGLRHGKPVEKRGVAPLGARGIEVVGIGLEDLGRGPFDPFRHNAERGVLRLGRGERKRDRRLPGAAPHEEHHRLDSGFGSVGNRAHHIFRCITISSRWINSARPKYPRISAISPLLRPMMALASSWS